MNRRDFLRRAGAAVAAMGIDPELLVWQPRQMVVVPARPLLMGGLAGGGKHLTLVEWARQMDPQQRIAKIVDLLNAENELLGQIRFTSTPWQDQARRTWAELVKSS